jgi:hypothetical protein
MTTIKTSHCAIRSKLLRNGTQASWASSAIGAPRLHRGAQNAATRLQTGLVQRLVQRRGAGLNKTTRRSRLSPEVAQACGRQALAGPGARMRRQ